jgi:hypothetical protein
MKMTKDLTMADLRVQREGLKKREVELREKKMGIQLQINTTIGELRKIDEEIADLNQGKLFGGKK